MVYVVVAQGIEQQPSGELDVAGQDTFDQGPALASDGDLGGALVLGGGAAGDETGLLQQTGLVGQAAAAG